MFGELTHELAKLHGEDLRRAGCFGRQARELRTQRPGWGFTRRPAAVGGRVGCLPVGTA